MILRRTATALASVLLLAAAPATTAPEADLSSVNPELRPMARVILEAQRKGNSFTPPKLGALPAGVEERKAPGSRGYPAVPVYVVNSRPTAGSPRGAIYYVHGGGFIGGDARENLSSLKSMAARLNCVIVSVQYRLAPGNRFPGPLEDAYAGLKWLHANAAALGVDPARIVVLGESAGGGLAAMLTIAARDRGEVPVAYQALVYPMLDDRTGSSRPVPPHIGQLIWTAKSNRQGWQALLGREPGAASQPAGSVPARVTNLKGLPPTFIEVGSIDLFAEEDIEFARRLVNAGVPTELLVVPGAFHGFQFIAPRAAVSQQFTAALDAALARALSPEKN
jgi:acetyl esterase/lipase